LEAAQHGWVLFTIYDRRSGRCHELTIFEVD
jgi:hypothetical protein